MAADGTSPATSPTSTGTAPTRSPCTRSRATARRSPFTPFPEVAGSGRIAAVEGAVSAGEGLAVADREAAGGRLLPGGEGVGVEHATALAGEEAGGHLVVGMGELDHERGAEVGEEGDDLVERHGVGEGEVVDDGEAEHEIGTHPLDEWGS